MLHALSANQRRLASYSVETLLSTCSLKSSYKVAVLLQLRTVDNTLKSLLNSAVHLVPGRNGTMNVIFEVVVVVIQWSSCRVDVFLWGLFFVSIFQLCSSF